MSHRSLAFSLVLILGLPGAASAIEVHAHRGGSGPAPENSLPAFQAAIALGVDALEMDLQLTRDGVLVVHHDAKLDRSLCRVGTAGELAVNAISKLSSADLERITCNGELVPRFDEVLALVADSDSAVRLTVELKFNGGEANAPRPKLAWRVLAALEKAGLADRTIIQSFDAEVLALIESMDPDQSLGLITRSPAKDAARLEGSGIDVLLPRFDRLTREVVSLCHEQGVRVLAWTVNDPGDLARFVTWGVDGIITDRPERMLDELGRNDPEPVSAPGSAEPVAVATSVPAMSFDEPAYRLREVRTAAVMPFTSRGRVDTFCTSIFEEVVRERPKSGFPELVDVYRLPFTVADGRPLSLRANLDAMLLAARKNGAEAIVVGEGNWYGPFGNRWRMEIRLIEVNQGRVLWTTTGKSGPAISGPQAKNEVVRECVRDFRRGR